MIIFFYQVKREEKSRTLKQFFKDFSKHDVCRLNTLLCEQFLLMVIFLYVLGEVVQKKNVHVLK